MDSAPAVSDANSISPSGIGVGSLGSRGSRSQPAQRGMPGTAEPRARFQMKHRRPMNVMEAPVTVGGGG
jgi:hypothetical protein